MARNRLAIAIPTFNRGAMLDAVLASYVPACERLGVAVALVDNASADATPDVLAAWQRRSPAVRSRRQIETVPVGRNIMDAMALADADYVWFAGDDDCLLPARIAEVVALLREESPSAVVVGTAEVPSPGYADLAQPLGPQVASLAAGGASMGNLAMGASGPRRDHDDAVAFFEVRHVCLPAPSVVYRRDTTLATDFVRYIPTHHPHIGALFDDLAREQAERGRIHVVEFPAVHSVSLTVHDERGKKNWSEIFHFLAHEGFPKWFSMLPPLYQPHLAGPLAFQRHIFRAAFEASR